jgi:amidase
MVGHRARFAASGFAVVFLVAACARPTPDIAEAGIAELGDRMRRGDLTSETLVRGYLDRIEAIDRDGPTLNAVLEINPDALLIARALDEERSASGPRGPMHGIPVILKANIDTGDRMRTSAGALVLADHVASEDAFLAARLRDAGAVILGKANLSEWANFRSRHSSSGWSTLGGQTNNAYDPTRNPCGSSSGSAVAVAASLATVAVGTETDGSIVCPSGANGIVGIKPTLGIVSRAGIVPIAHSQDTAGPMARTVQDAAILLGAMAGEDPNDAATSVATRAGVDFTAGLRPDALSGKRVGVIRSHRGAGSDPRVEAILEAALAAIRRQGARVVDPVEIDTRGIGDAEFEVLLFEFRHDLNAYLERAGARVSSLEEVIQFNLANAEEVMPHFGQDILLAANERGGLDSPDYEAALSASRDAMRAALEAAFAEHELDALIAITNGPAWKTDLVNGDSFHISSSSYAAVSGYPNVTVPAGRVAGLPVGVSFIGRPFDDAGLIGIAFAFEQATLARRPPAYE